MTHVSGRGWSRGMMVAALFLAACGDAGPVDPGEDPVEVTGMAMTIVSGDGQAAPVRTLLPEPLGVAVTADEAGALSMHVGTQASLMYAPGDPVPGVVVSFVVTDEGCGRPFAGAALTDTAGRVMERWELGSRAGLCRMEARAVDPVTGEPLVFDTFTATAEAGPVATFTLATRTLTPAVGAPIALRALIQNAADAYGNAVAVPAPVVITSGDLTVSGDTVTATEEGVTVVRFMVGTRTDSVTVYAAHDLTAEPMVAVSVCSGGMTRAGVAVDSARVEGPVAVTGYQPHYAEPGVRTFTAGLNLTVTFYNADGSTTTAEDVRTYPSHQVIPDRLEVGGTLYMERTAEGYVVSAATAPDQPFRSLCPDAFPVRGDVAFTFGG